jgi:hypothetical protein
LAHENNYEVVPVKGDGNCLFRAVSKSLKLNHNRNYRHEELRSMVVEYLSNNPEFLELYLEYVVEPSKTPRMTPKEYLKKMAKPKTWGDFICLITLSEILQVQFNLLILNTRSFQIISNNDAFTAVVPLGFIDDYHYTALVPLESVRPGPSIAPSVRPGPSIAPSVRPGPSIAPSVRPGPSIAPSVRPGPSIAPSVIPGPSIAPSVIPGPSIAPSVRPGPSIAPSLKPSVVPKLTPSIAPKIPPPVFGPVKPLSSTRELLEEADKVHPYVREDISQLARAEEQILVSLGM